jgi:hypothetical protein
MGQVKPDQVARFKFDRFVLLIVIAGLKVLSFLDIFNKAIINFMKVGGEIVCGKNRRRREFS